MIFDDINLFYKLSWSLWFSRQVLFLLFFHSTTPIQLFASITCDLLKALINLSLSLSHSLWLSHPLSLSLSLSPSLSLSHSLWLSLSLSLSISLSLSFSLFVPLSLWLSLSLSISLYLSLSLSLRTSVCISLFVCPFVANTIVRHWMVCRPYGHTKVKEDFVRRMIFSWTIIRKLFS